MKKIGDVCNHEYKFNSYEDDNSYYDDLTKDLGDNYNKQEIFDRFLTYRRRMARMAAIQALYLYDIRNKKLDNHDSNNMFKNTNNGFDTVQLCQDVIYFYRNVFFTQQEYGWTKKSKKIDETFMFELTDIAILNINEIDSLIQSRLTGNWTTEKLDFLLRAILRCAIAELLLGIKIEKAVLCSEYTNLAGNFFGAKEVGFINGIVDKLYSVVIKLHPFMDGIVIKTEDSSL